MRKLKTWTACIVSGFDSVISKVENHESVVSSSIQELQTAATHARVKLNRLRQEIKRMEAKHAQLEQSRSRWNERAVGLRATDKPKAIECLRRRKAVESELAHLENELPNHTSVASSIEADLRKLDTQIEDLKLRKRAFSTRASRAQAMKISGSYSAQAGESLEDTFERWEMKLAETEICSHPTSDSLEDAFLKEEELLELEAELAELEDTEPSNATQQS